MTIYISGQWCVVPPARRSQRRYDYYLMYVCTWGTSVPLLYCCTYTVCMYLVNAYPFLEVQILPHVPECKVQKLMHERIYVSPFPQWQMSTPFLFASTALRSHHWRNQRLPSDYRASLRPIFILGRSRAGSLRGVSSLSKDRYILVCTERGRRRSKIRRPPCGAVPVGLRNNAYMVRTHVLYIIIILGL